MMKGRAGGQDRKSDQGGERGRGGGRRQRK